MLRVSAGPAIKHFGEMFCGIPYGHGGTRDYSEVVDWVNAYINGPWPKGLLEHIEPTAEEREASIKKYITWRNETSLTSKIKNEIKERENERD